MKRLNQKSKLVVIDPDSYRKIRNYSLILNTLHQDLETLFGKKLLNLKGQGFFYIAAKNYQMPPLSDEAYLNLINEIDRQIYERDDTVSSIVKCSNSRYARKILTLELHFENTLKVDIVRTENEESEIILDLLFTPAEGGWRRKKAIVTKEELARILIEAMYEFNQSRTWYLHN